MIHEISINEFANIYEGEGNNEGDAPLKSIFPAANNLALFAVTMGSRISEKIESLFKSNDFALASMLDTVASLAADSSTELLEAYFLNKLSNKYPTNNDSIVLSYSPGYCGWNISGQKKLFNYLHPERIGIKLNKTFLMTPLKSVTGVLVHGEKNIHLFESSFNFCDTCKNKTCYDRMSKILQS